MRALFVTDGTLQAPGVPPTRGRWFTEADYAVAAGGPAPIVLSNAFWQRRFGGDETALGRALSSDAPSGFGTLRAGTASLVDEIRQAVRSVSASIPIGEERTMQGLYAGSLARTSFTLVLLGIAGAMAWALGVIGIYGVIAYVVAQGRREIGIRAALGARPGQIERMFLRQGLTLTLVGADVGLVGAVAVARVMSSLLFGTRPLDVSAYAGALGATLAAAALASYLPALRAAAIDPIETLRSQLGAATTPNAPRSALLSSGPSKGEGPT